MLLGGEMMCACFMSMCIGVGCVAVLLTKLYISMNVNVKVTEPPCSG